MTNIYEIYADEAWTHGGEPPNRYWCFFGGIFGSESSLERLNTELKKIKAANNIKGEVKWTNVAERNLSCYKEMVDCLCSHIRTSDIRYRQQFSDRALVRIPLPGEPAVTDLTVQFKLFYQFLKHAFGIKYMARSENDNILLLARLDDHSSVKHKQDLREFVQGLPEYWGRTDLIIKVSFIDSKKHERLQICDLMMGAAGFYGNKFHMRRNHGRGGAAHHGMSQSQKIKLDLAKHIYNQLRSIDAMFRNSKAFNWFETTGLNGDLTNQYNDKIRIWKFKPGQSDLDKGWQNNNLRRDGIYLGPQIASIVK